MKTWLAWLLLPFLSAHHIDCYQMLFDKGKAAFDQKDYPTAITKWRGAIKCPESDHQRQALLLQWIELARERQGSPNKINPPPRRDFVEKFNTLPNHSIGALNWSGQYAEAEGQSVLDLARYPNEAQALAMATRGAEIVAYANLLEILQGVRVQRTTTIRDLITESDVVRTEVQGMVRGARRIGEPNLEKGLVTVRVRVQLDQLRPLARLTDAAAGSARPPESRPEPVGWLLSAAPGDTALLLRFADGRFDPSLVPILADSTGQTLFYFAPLLTADGPASTPDWTGPNLQVQAVQNPNGTIRLVDPAQEVSLLRYLQRRMQLGQRGLPTISFLP